MPKLLRIALTLALFASATACKKERGSKKSKSKRAIATASNPTPTPAPTPTPFVPTGAAFFLSNPDGPNTVEAFSRNTATGLLTYLGSFPTGGNGSKAIQGSQAHAVVVKGNFLYAVNSGSDSFSTFRIGSDGRPTWLATTPSNGVRPVSIAVHGNLLFVLNQGIDNGNNLDDPDDKDASIRGFSINYDGTPLPIGNATFSFLYSDSPSDVFFLGDEFRLAVLKSGSDSVEAFNVSPTGELSNNQTITVGKFPGNQPVGGAANSNLPGIGFAAVIANKAGNGASVVSFSANTSLTIIQPEVDADEDIDPCWAVTSIKGDRLWSSNFMPKSLTLYLVDGNGTLTPSSSYTPLNDTGPGSLDLDVSADGRFLYRLRAFSTIEGEPNPTPIVEVFEIESSTSSTSSTPKGGVNLIQWLSPNTTISWTDASPTGMAVTSP
jgi:6-phosphogluconolactonase (cycloisomerase 2 family)